MFKDNKQNLFKGKHPKCKVAAVFLQRDPFSHFKSIFPSTRLSETKHCKGHKYIADSDDGNTFRIACENCVALHRILDIKDLGKSKSKSNGNCEDKKKGNSIIIFIIINVLI